MKTLIAEDDFTSCFPLQEFLKSYGPSHIAVNGKEAVEAVRSALEAGDPCDLICLDVIMPEMDGHEALKVIRAQEEASGIHSATAAKIVITTAMGDLKNVYASFSNLCDGYRIKPIEKIKLLEKLRKMGLIP
jgi:two-component system, chemotaxis family, chemotaxis protein CheY